MARVAVVKVASATLKAVAASFPKFSWAPLERDEGDLESRFEEGEP